jgi:hypothetical protein
MTKLFYENLNKIEALLQKQVTIELLPDGLILFNRQIIDTNQQLEMLTPAFFTTRSDNPAIQQFKLFFERMGVLPKDTTHFPLIRDIPLRSQTVNDASGEQRQVFAKFLSEGILGNQWTQLFPDIYETLAVFTRDLYVQGAAGTQQEVNGVQLRLHVLTSQSEEGIEQAVIRTLHDAENTTAIVEALVKPSLCQVEQVAFNIRGVARDCYSLEDIQQAVFGGGHQYFLTLDRRAKTIVAINNTSYQSESDLLFFKDQVDTFLTLIGDATPYGFQLLSGKSRQPDEQTYLSQVCGISQFCDYIALLSGVETTEIEDEVPPCVTTLMYVLQFALEHNHPELLEMLQELGGTLNQACTGQAEESSPETKFKPSY